MGDVELESLVLADAGGLSSSDPGELRGLERVHLIRQAAALGLKADAPSSAVKASLPSVRSSDPGPQIQKQISDQSYRLTNQQVDMLYNGGQTTFSGFYWMDTICLWQVEIESERVPNSGGFCVNN